MEIAWLECSSKKGCRARPNQSSKNETDKLKNNHLWCKLVIVWQIEIPNKVKKQIDRLPKKIQIILQALIADLQLRGAALFEWPNYSKIGKDKYHCHISYKWVACWTIENKELRIIEVYYVGSRENAPY